MKNLKRILSLALAGTMLIGMMVVGASAVEFGDADKIEHTAAVETMVALGIIEGATQLDGSVNFAPEGKLDRAAMAKMIAVIMNGGKAPLFADTTKPSFVDVKAGNWAVPYIEYCANFGYVNGYGNGYFGPNDELTGTQAARMILNALGYKWDGNGSWELATEVQARDGDINLYNDLEDLVPGEVMTRDAAAQMLLNAINAPLYDGKVTATNYYYVSLAETPANVSGQKLAALTALVGRPFDSYFEAFTMAQAVTDDDAKLVADFNITPRPVNRVETMGEKYLDLHRAYITLNSVKLDDEETNLTYGMYAINDGVFYLEEDTCSDLIGEYVTVLYDDDENVYGVIERGGVIYEGTVGEYIASVKAMSAGSKKTALLGKIASAYVMNWNTTSSSVVNLEDLDPSYSLQILMDTDYASYGLPLTFYVKPYEVATVSYLTATNINVAGATNYGTEVNGKLEDVNLYEGVKKGDLVMVTPASSAVNGKPTLSLMETVEGKVDGKRSDTNAVLVGGTWYPKAKVCTTEPAVGAEGALSLVNGYYVAFQADEDEAEAADMVFVLKTAPVTNVLDDNTYRARVITTEGKKIDIDITNDEDVDALEGAWHAYSVKNGVYTLDEDPADAEITGYYKDYSNVYFDYDASGSKLMGTNGGTEKTVRVADDAVVVVLHNLLGADKKSVNEKTYTINAVKTDINDLATLKPMTGKDLNTMGDDLGQKNNGNINVAFTQVINGIEYAKFVFIAATVKTLPGAKGEIDNYGYIVSDPYQTKVGSTTYTTFEMWNGEENVTVNATLDKTYTNPKKGDIVTYEDMGNNVIKDVKIPAGLTPGAVVGINNDTLSFLTGNTSGKDNVVTADLDKDVQIFYVDSAKVAGQAGGSIQFAIQDTRNIRPAPDAGDLFVNAKFIGTDGGTITLLFVEINNQWAAGADFEVAKGGTIQNPTLTVSPATAKEHEFFKEIVMGVTASIDATKNPGAYVKGYQWQKWTPDAEHSGSTPASPTQGEWKNIAGATSKNYTAKETGYYRAVVTVGYKPNAVGAEQEKSFESASIQVKALAGSETPAANGSITLSSSTTEAQLNTQTATTPVFTIDNPENLSDGQIAGWGIKAEDKNNYLYFRYNATAEHYYTLTISQFAADGKVMYVETSNNPATKDPEKRPVGANYCGIDITGKTGAPEGAWRQAKAGGTTDAEKKGLVTGKYYYTITDETGATYASGIFSVTNSTLTAIPAAE